MRLIVASSLRFRFLVVALAGALVFFGTQSLENQKLDVFPEFAPPQVQIQTEGLGLSSSEMEELITVPLENGLSGVPNVQVVRSESVPQLSAITLLFKKGTNLIQARRFVQERLQTVATQLPTFATTPSMYPPVSATSRIMALGLSSHAMSPENLSMLAYWTIRARLLRVPGVANVAIWGEKPQQLQVQVDPRRMQANHVTLDHAMTITADALDAGLLRFSSGAVVGTGGFLEGNQRIPVRSSLPIAAPADLARVPLEKRGNKTLRIGNVANVVYGHPPLIGDAVVNGGPGLLMVIEKFPGSNTVAVTKGVEQAIKDLRPGLPGVNIDTKIFRPATFIELAIHNLTLAVIIGCVLVVLVLVAFLLEWRAAFISLVTIPLSLIAATIVLDIRGETINTLVLAGFAVAVGVVVDDAIIDIENIVRRLRARRAQGSRIPIAPLVLAASLEVRSAILYATLINVVAVLPVIFVGGLSGSFFGPLALSYSIAVLASMVIALTLTPALALILLAKAPLKRDEPGMVRQLKAGYEWALSRIVRRPRAAYLTVGIVSLAGFAVLPGLGQDLFPTFKERGFLMHWVTKPGTSIREERRIVTQSSNEFRSIPGITHFGSHIGQAFLGEEIAGPNFGENWISMSKKADYARTIKAIRAVEETTPGLFHDVQTYLRERIDEVLAGSPEAIVVRIFGTDLTVLRQQADSVARELSSVSGLVDLHPEPQQPVPQIRVQVKLPVARKYGLKPGDVRRAASTLVAGEEVGDIFRGGRIYGVAVWSTPHARQNLQDLVRLQIDTPTGGRVALGKVADVRITPIPSDIKRENESRRIDVDANTSGRDLGSIIADIKQKLSQHKFPLGYHAELLGEAAERQKAQDRLLLLALGAGVIALLLLQAAFGNWRLAWLLYLTLPMALVGGLLAASAAVGTISLGALIGFYAVLGIAARNGIMMITHFQHLERYEDEPFGIDLVLRGARERLRPILMTAFATGLALTPLVITGSKPGQEIEHPMAIVILGGLVTSTLLNLFVVPALYLRFGRGTSMRQPVGEREAAWEKAVAKVYAPFRRGGNEGS